MEKWTVILKGPNGLDFEVVEADAADWSEDGRQLEFSDTEAATEVLAAIAALAAGSMKEMTPEQAKAELTRILRTIGRAKVASFEREAVLGYFMGLRANVEVRVTPRPKT